MRKTGKRGKGQNTAIKFRDAGSEAEAIALAKKWLAGQLQKNA